MKGGLLMATTKKSVGAKGIAVTGAKAGEDVGVSHTEGLVSLKKGKIMVLEVPTVQKGGSRKIDIPRLKALVKARQQVGAIGMEALASLRKAGIEPATFRVTSYHQLAGAVWMSLWATSDAVPDLIKLRESDLECEMVSLAPGSSSHKE
jgi:putative transcriptional regulator